MKVTTIIVCALSLASGVSARAQNLVFNGDFELGNTGFGTQYVNAAGNSTEGQYNVRANPSSWNGAFAAIADHTPSPGTLMMVINGATSGALDVWTQTVPVVPGGTYEFSGWVANLVSGPSADLSVRINGQVVVASFAAPPNSFAWNRFAGTWTANSSQASIVIVNLNTSRFPNDFAIDDLSLVAALPPCPADLTGDGFVDDSDFVIFAAAYEAFTIPPADPAADLTADGFVDDSDFVLFAAAYALFNCP